MVAERELIDGLARKLERYRTDPVGFCSDILGFEPHAGQAAWLRAAIDQVDKDEAALVTGNRWGKSFIAAAKRIWKCAYQIGWSADMVAKMSRMAQPYQSLNVSVTAQQANLVWSNAYALLSGPKASWLVKDVKMTPFPTIHFVNGAQFQARSTAGNGHHLLGISLDDLNWDEAAYEPKFLQIRDNVLRMRLVDRDGRLDYTSTGNGRNDFGRMVLSALGGKEPDLYAQSGTTWDNPHISRERVTKNASRMSERMRLQNIEGAIVEGGGDFFEAEDLAAAVDTDLNDLLVVHAEDDDDLVAWAELYPETDVPWRLRFQSHRYVHFWDLADKRDWTVGSTFDISTRPRATLVEFERFHKRGWKHVYARIRDRHRRYRGATGIDATGVGDAVRDELADCVEAENAIVFTKPMKDALLSNWQTMINLRQVRWPHIGPWVEEHGFYSRDDAQLVKDCVMSGAGAGYMMRRGIAAPPISTYR